MENRTEKLLEQRKEYADILGPYKEHETPAREVRIAEVLLLQAKNHFDLYSILLKMGNKQLDPVFCADAQRTCQEIEKFNNNVIELQENNTELTDARRHETRPYVQDVINDIQKHMHQLLAGPQPVLSSFAHEQQAEDEERFQHSLTLLCNKLPTSHITGNFPKFSKEILQNAEDKQVKARQQFRWQTALLHLMHDWKQISLQEKREITNAFNVTANTLRLQAQCPSCGEAGSILVSKSKNINNGVFQIQHTKPKRTVHGGSAIFPKRLLLRRMTDI